jgi:hypothetical protein
MVTLDLDKRTELCCPKCGKPLLIEPLSENRSRFLGCGRDCLDIYMIPNGSVAFGPLGGPQFLYGPALV